MNLAYLLNIYKEFFKNYFNFSGKVKRKDFWMVVLCHAIIVIPFSLLIVIFAMLAVMTDSLAIYGFASFLDLILSIYGLAIVIPSTGLLVRRFNDVGISGWWVIAGYVLFAVPNLIVACLPSNALVQNKISE